MTHELKIGDRVRYLGPRSDWANFTGKITNIAEYGMCRVTFDQTYYDGRLRHGYGISPDSLELIMTTIDTTKPLMLETKNNPGTVPVPFVTETSEGHILVGKPASGPGSALQWIIFTDQGEPVRCDKGDISPGSWCSSLRLKNAPVVKTYSEVINSGQHVISLNITEVDGELTNVEWVQ